MATSTTTRTYTTTHTATFLTDVARDGITRLLEHLGVGAGRIVTDWRSLYEPAIRAWIEERSLKAIVVECTTPAGRTTHYEFRVDYTDGGGTFRNRMATMVDYFAKVGKLPAGTRWRVVCRYNGWHSDQPGWSPTSLNDLSGLAMSLGTVGRAPHANLDFTYHED